MGKPLDETNGPPPSPGRGGDKRWSLGTGWYFCALRNGEIQLLSRQGSFSVSPCQSTGRWGQGLKLQASGPWQVISQASWPDWIHSCCPSVS